MNTIPFRKLSSLEWVSRGSESGPAYAEYLRERFPMGSVVAINLVTGKYVVGGASPQALHMYRDKFGRKPSPTCGSNRSIGPTRVHATKRSRRWPSGSKSGVGPAANDVDCPRAHLKEVVNASHLQGAVGT